MAPALYDRIGTTYSEHRRPDPRIAAQLGAALGPARTVLNVGAGTGSYEPRDRAVAAVEPSGEMIRQRPATAAPAVRASAEALPFRERAFDAALAVLTIHHWPDWRAGLRQMQRIARDRVVLLTWDPAHPGFWLVQEYFPEILAVDRRIFPTLAGLREALGPLEVHPVPVPGDCADGFLGAYWRRPERYLDPGVRGAISSFARVPRPETGLARLRRDLADGSWERRHGALRAAPDLDLGYRLVRAAGCDSAAAPAVRPGHVRNRSC